MTVQQTAPNPLVHKVSLNPGNETTKAKTRLDQIFEEREERAAKRYSAAEMEKMALEAENEAARLRGEPPPHKYHIGGEEVDEEKKKQQDEARKQQLLISAKALIDSGMEPHVIGQMLLGLPTTSGGGVALAQGMGVDDVLKIVTMIVGQKESHELKGIIASLDKKVDDLTKVGIGKKEESKPLDPIAFAKQQAEAVVAWNKALELLRPPPPAPSERGDSLEVVKERNRHAEKMEEIQGEKDYKQGLVEVAGDIPIRIGHGIASRYSEGHNKDNSGDGLESITCTGEGCGTKIFITPSTGNQVECPKCGAIYARKATIESKAG